MSNVIPGAEAWSAAGGDTGVLLLHGFTGSPVSLRPLAEALARAGYAVELPQLPGHGTRWEDLVPMRWQDWAREAAVAFERLRARTVRQAVVGLSVGGALALHLAESRPDDLAGVVVINPSVCSDDPRRFVAPLVGFLVRSVEGVANDIAKPGMDEGGYDRRPARATVSVNQLHGIVRRHLAKVTAPLLVFTSRQDHVVPTRGSDIVVKGVSSADVQRVWLEDSFHVATLDYDAPVIERETLAFLRDVAGDAAAGDATAS